MNKRIKQANHFKNVNFISIFSILLVLFLISLSLAVIINFIHGKFSWRLIKIAAINSITLGASVLLNILVFRMIITRVKLYQIYLISLALMLVIYFSGFLYIFILEPFFFFYGSDLLRSYFLINFIFSLSLIIISNSFLISQEAFELKNRIIFQERLLRQQMEEQLYNSKINPHFLFNSLNLLLTLLPETQKAEEALIKLSELLRFHLSVSDKKNIPLSLELENMEKYVYLQKLRFKNRINYKVSGPVKGSIPPFAIQPLVENSIKHNIQNVKKLDIEVTISYDEDRLSINVMDSCCALKESMLGSGKGLEITKKRLELLGGTLSIHQGKVILTVPQNKGDDLLVEEK